MSDYGDLDDERMGLKPQNQNSIGTWATRLRDDTSFSHKDFLKELFDDHNYGIFTLCNPNSLLNGLMQFERIDYPKNTTQIDISYADDTPFVQLQGRHSCLPGFMKFLDMCNTLFIYSKSFPTNKQEQMQWLQNVLTQNRKDDIVKAMHQGQTKLSLLIKWFACQENLSVDDWKEKNTRNIIRTRRVYSSLARMTKLFAANTWIFKKLKPQQDLPIQWDSFNVLANTTFIESNDLSTIKNSLITLKKALTIVGISVELPHSNPEWKALLKSAIKTVAVSYSDKNLKSYVGIGT